MAKLTSTDIYGSLNVQGITNLGDSLTGSSATFLNANIGLANINTMRLSNLNIGEAEAITWSIDASNPASFFIRDEYDAIRFTITSEGKVGIGTSTPGQILSVNGSIEGTNIISDYILGTGTRPTKELFNNSSFSTLNIGTQMGTDSHAYLGSNRTTVHIPGSLVVDGTMTINSVEMVSTSSGIVFEGPTINDYQTTLNAIDPTADRNILLPNASGTVLISNNAKTAGYFYGGTTSPTNTNRLNYDGYVYATKVFSGGAEVYTTSNLPAYPTSFNLTDDILDGSANKYTPYTTQQNKLSFDKSSTAPSRTDRLNLNGYLYATKLFSGGVEVLTTHPTVSAASSVNNSGRTYIQDITVDSFGHITGISSATETVVDTNTTYSQSWVDSGANAILRLSAGGSGTGNNDLTLVAGSNITLTPSGDNLTIASTYTDTLNTAGSTNTSSKIYLVGATSQASSAQTYSDDEVYVTNGTLTTKEVQVGGTAATMKYDSTSKSIKFVFI